MDSVPNPMFRAHCLGGCIEYFLSLHVNGIIVLGQLRNNGPQLAHFTSPMFPRRFIL